MARLFVPTTANYWQSAQRCLTIRHTVNVRQINGIAHLTSRRHSTKVLSTESSILNVRSNKNSDAPALAILPTTTILRSILLGACFASPLVTRTMIALMQYLLNSKASVLRVDRNPVVRQLVRVLAYDHFCAGVNPKEVKQTVARMKDLGCSGVILGFAREVVIKDDAELKPDEQKAGEDQQVEQWLQDNLDTLGCIGKDDILGVKLTGAGPRVSRDLMEGKMPSEQVKSALSVICDQAIRQGSRVWIDAEQQVFQATIDVWAMELMREYNTNGTLLVYNTVQAYLKASRASVLRHLKKAQAEGWSLGIKLVRGAYIASDKRNRIWDTKAQTDESYNSLARDMLSKSFAEMDAKDFPDLHLFLAGHNKTSIESARSLVSELCSRGEHVNPVGYGQLQGMADDISCALIQRQRSKNQMDMSIDQYGNAFSMAPKTYKTLSWGPVQDCMNFLVRRAIENSTAAERLKDSNHALRKELMRRIFQWPAWTQR